MKFFLKSTGRLPAMVTIAFAMLVAVPSLFVACQDIEIVDPDDKKDDVDTTSPVVPGIDTVTPVNPGEDTIAPVGPGVDTLTPVDPGTDTTSPVGPGIDTTTPADPGIDTTAGPDIPEDPHDTLGPDEMPAFTYLAIEGVEYCHMVDNMMIVVLPTDKSLEDAEITYKANVANVTFRKSAASSGDTFSFEQGKSYPFQLTAEDGRTSAFKVKVFRFDLPVFFIESNLVNSKNTWVNGAEFTIRYATGDTIHYTGRIKGRGNSTWWWPKKPYTIGLDNRHKFFEMKKHKRWNLMANWKDHTLMRNDVAFEIARRTDLEWTPSGEFVELVNNGVHRGNYYLCEKISVDKHRIDIHELQPDDEDVSGGYLLEIATDEYAEATKTQRAVPCAFMSPVYNLPFVIHEPDPDVITQEQYDYIYNYISKVEKLLKSSTSLNNGDYQDYIDIDTFADWYLAIELTGLWEPNQPKSCYMYKDQGGKLKAGPVWDFDWSTFNPGYDGLRIKNTLWYPRLLRSDIFSDKLDEEWQKHRDSLYDVLDYISQRKQQLLFSGVVDKEMWPFSTSISTDVNGDEFMTFDAACDRMYDAYRERWEWMDSLFGE